MSLTEIVDWLKDREQRAQAEAVQFAEQHLPVLADVAQKAEANPLVQAAFAVTHVSPEVLSGMATVLLKLDADLEAAEAAKTAAEQAAAAAQAPAEPEPEPAPA